MTECLVTLTIHSGVVRTVRLYNIDKVPVVAVLNSLVSLAERESRLFLEYEARAVRVCERACFHPREQRDLLPTS